MSYYVTNENSFLDIKNAHLRVTGNVHTDVLKVGSIGFQPTGSNIPGTVNFTNVTTGVTTSSNLDVGGTLNLGTVELSASTHTLDHITARGNVTSTTVQFDNATTGLVTTANVEVGGELTVSGNVEVGGELTVTSNLTVSGFVGSSGTGALTVPSGTTAEQPTGVAGMIRYNSTLDKYEGRVSTIWMPMTGEPPLYEFISHTFTSAGTTGKTGPSLPTLTGHSDYSTAAWRTDTDNFSLGHETGGSARAGFQLWTVPETGNYTIEAHGASGGDSVNRSGGPPGKGAIVTDNFNLTSGIKLILIVGQRGVSNPSTYTNNGSGGGGASWVLKENFTTSTSDVYMVAGGGGGETDPMYYGTPGSNATSAVASQASVSTTNGGQSGYFTAGGGAGFVGDGLSSAGGLQPRNGAVGGGGTSSNHSGGFGGGGGAGNPNGGGGGGYSGGKGAATPSSYTSGGGAGGGTCRSNGLSPSFSVSSTSEDGYIIITKN